MGRHFNGFCGRVTCVRGVRCSLGSSGQAHKDASFCPVPYNDICGRIGQTVSQRCCSPSWFTKDYRLELRTSDHFNFLMTNMLPVGDRPTNVYCVSSTDRWSD